MLRCSHNPVTGAAYREAWTADMTGHLAGRKGLPRARVNACGALLDFGLAAGKTLAATEVDGGQRYEADANTRLFVQDAKKFLFPTALDRKLLPDVPGTIAAVQWDKMPVLEVRDGIARVEFHLGLPPATQMHFQGPLDAEAVERGDKRPFVGSFVLIGMADGGTGHWNPARFGDLHRPLLVDAAGETLWADWLLDGDRLYKTFPVEWLSRAGRKWPVLDPSYLGHQGTPATQTSSSSGKPLLANGNTAGGYLMPEAGTISGMSMCCDSSPAGTRFTLGLYADGGNKPSGSPIRDTGGGTAPGAKAWATDQALDSSYAAGSAEKLWLTFNKEGVILYFYYDAVAGCVTFLDYLGSYTHGTLPTAPVNNASQAYQYGLRATYTPGGAANKAGRLVNSVPLKSLVRGGLVA